jgi:hypothetical protein
MHDEPNDIIADCAPPGACAGPVRARRASHFVRVRTNGIRPFTSKAKSQRQDFHVSTMAYGEPDWASPGSTGNSVTVNAATPSAVSAGNGVGQNTNTGSAL